jgi:hypothetical protein
VRACNAWRAGRSRHRVGHLITVAPGGGFAPVYAADARDPTGYPVDEAHSCLIQSPSRAITTDIGEIRTYSHCEIE